LSLVVVLQTAKYWIDVAFIQLLVAVLSHFFAKLFVVSGTKSRYRSAVDTAKLATRIVVIKNIVCRVLLIDAIAVSAFYHMNAIVFTIK
jgi:hypothetical protein